MFFVSHLNIYHIIFSLALLRPGRFEVQIEIPPPRTTEQRVSILKVHTKHMLSTGRLQVNDPPPGTTAEKMLEVSVVNSLDFLYSSSPAIMSKLNLTKNFLFRRTCTTM
jgi:SpoVK/Ycf46/Vps4 family AAA+-type ATPase